ncbi:MAG: RNA polymerase sigma factor [Acidimicrobiales bacterium]
MLAEARAGEPRAHDRIFTVLSPVVAAYFRLRGATEPEDLTSEVFAAVLPKLNTFDGDEGGFDAWVFTIANRRLSDEWRRASKRPITESLSAASATEQVAPDDVESTVERSLARERVQALCETLHPHQREVLVLRLLGNLTVAEVAELVGKTPGAVKALQRRGLQKIKRLLQQEGTHL